MSARESLLQAFFDSTDVAFYIKDEQGRFLLVNRYGAELLGMTEEECIGKTAFDLIPKEEADRTTHFDRKVAETGAPTNFKSIVSLPTGQRTLLDRKFPVSAKNYPNAVGGVIIDVTET